MSLVSGSVPNLISGVSQQAVVLRLAAQAEESLNGFPSVVSGLDKRPGTEHIAKLSGAVPDDVFTHTINRDSSERYVVVIHSGDLFVYGFDGLPRTVNFPNGKGYLAGADYSAVTIADFTFVVNRTVKAAMAATTQPKRSPEALLVVRAGNYSTSYSVTIDAGPGTEFGMTHTTAATGADAIKTEAIAQAIVSGINASGKGWTATLHGSTVHVTRADAKEFGVATSDSFADQALLGIKGRVQSAALLPHRAVQGFQLEIEGSPGNRYDNYFVEYRADGGVNTAGVWREIPKPGRTVAFNAATMPHVLVREADGTFTFREAQWDTCRAGDETTVPEPGIVGQLISDVFFYRNRLGMIGGEQVMFSKSGQFFDLWRETATDLLDTDPIDVAVSHVKVSNLRHAVPFNEALLLFSDQTQFAIPASEALTPRTIAINQATEFEASLQARPVGIGPYVYFGAARGGYTSVREYFLDGETRAADANDITSHVPEYVEGEILDMAGSSTENVLLVLAEGDRSAVWLYKFQFAGAEKVQAGWSKWKFDPADTILAVDFIQSSLWLVIKRADGLYLERMDLDPGRTLGSLPFVPRLDRMATGAKLSAAYDAGANATTFTLPYPESADLQVIVVANEGGLRAGTLLQHTRPEANKVVVKGNVPAASVAIGRRYELRHTFSPFLIRANAAGGGAVATNDGRLQVGKATINYTQSGYFRVEVTPYRRNTYTAIFAGRIVGSARTVIGQAGLETGSFSFAIRANNLNVKVDIVNDSPMPSRFLNMEWEGIYTPRSRRAD